MMSIINFFLDHLVGLIFPRCCMSCDNALNRFELDICMLCASQIPYFDFEEKQNTLALKFMGKQRLLHTAALYDFQKKTAIQQLIHGLKYKNAPEIGVRLGEKLGKRLVDKSLHNAFDIIVPVPLHPKRLKQRGYNQSFEIAIGIARVLSIEVQEKAIERVVYNNTQTRKRKIERWTNVETIFSVKPTDRLNGKHILLVDDIVTTGSTLEACCQELWKLSPASISIAAIAVAK